MMGVFTRRMMIAATICAGALGLAAPSAHAVDTDAAKSLVQDVSGRLITLVTSDKAKPEKRAEFETILTEVAAMQDIARVAIGRPWKEMNDSQRAEYEAAFTDYLSRAYMDRLNGYQGETLELGATENAGKKGVFVKTLVKRPSGGEAPLEVEWRVMDRNGPPQVFDISVEGVSLVVTQRNEFTSLLDSLGGDIDKFIARLKQGAEGD